MQMPRLRSKKPIAHSAARARALTVEAAHRAARARIELAIVIPLIAGVLLAALAVGVFVIGLQLQLPIWPGQR